MLANQSLRSTLVLTCAAAVVLITSLLYLIFLTLSDDENIDWKLHSGHHDHDANFHPPQIHEMMSVEVTGDSHPSAPTKPPANIIRPNALNSQSKSPLPPISRDYDQFTNAPSRYFGESSALHARSATHEATEHSRPYDPGPPKRQRVEDAGDEIEIKRQKSPNIQLADKSRPRLWTEDKTSEEEVNDDVDDNEGHEQCTPPEFACKGEPEIGGPVHSQLGREAGQRGEHDGRPSMPYSLRQRLQKRQVQHVQSAESAARMDVEQTNLQSGENLNSLVDEVDESGEVGDHDDISDEGDKRGWAGAAEELLDAMRNLRRIGMVLPKELIDRAFRNAGLLESSLLHTQHNP